MANEPKAPWREGSSPAEIGPAPKVMEWADRIGGFEAKLLAEEIRSITRSEIAMHKQEQCVYCKEWYPKPVSYHHSTEECRANEAALSNDKHRESPHEPPMVYDPQRGVMVKPGRSRSSKPWDGAPLTDAIWQRHTTDASALEGPARELEHYYEMASHACQLERELAAAKYNESVFRALHLDSYREILAHLSDKLVEITAESECKCGSWDSEYGCPLCDKWTAAFAEAERELAEQMREITDGMVEGFLR